MEGNCSDERETLITVRPYRFEPHRLTMNQKICILSSDSVLIPIWVGHTGIVSEPTDSHQSLQEIKQVYLVHLQIGKMAVTVYTSE